MNEGEWRRLIKQVRGGFVVPVLGAQLLADEGGDSKLQRHVALRVLEAYDVTEASAVVLPPFRELNAAVSHLIGLGHSAQELYVDVATSIDECASDPELVPDAIRQLAQVTDFRLFVTMTPDGVLARCLREANRRVVEVIHAPRLPADEWRDLPDASAQPAAVEAHILYMLGKARPAPVFAMHDEDVLEYAHNLMTRGSNTPTNFIAALQERSLLMLGCGLPDWLGRFFLRLTKKGRLSEHSRKEWLIEPQRADTDELSRFLARFSAGTEFKGVASPAKFIEELVDRWKRDRDGGGGGANGAGDAGGPASPELDDQMALPADAIFFVSYSRHADLERALRFVEELKTRLRVTQVEVWFDRTAIEPGEEYAREIRHGITKCDYFLPLLSLQALGIEEAFFFSEWLAAEERRAKMNVNRKFLLPLIVDTDFEPTRYHDKGVTPPAWSTIHFGFAPQGVPDERTLGTLQAMLRTARKRRSNQ